MLKPSPRFPVPIASKVKSKFKFNKCATPTCTRLCEHPPGCHWDRCCKQGFVYDCTRHDQECDKKYPHTIPDAVPVPSCFKNTPFFDDHYRNMLTKPIEFSSSSSMAASCSAADPMSQAKKPCPACGDKGEFNHYNSDGLCVDCAGIEVPVDVMKKNNYWRSQQDCEGGSRYSGTPGRHDGE